MEKVTFFTIAFLCLAMLTSSWYKMYRIQKRLDRLLDKVTAKYGGSTMSGPLGEAMALAGGYPATGDTNPKPRENERKPSPEEIQSLITQLRGQAKLASDAHKMLAQCKSLRQDDNHEQRNDLYDWLKPEQTLEGRAADALEALIADRKTALFKMEEE